MKSILSHRSSFALKAAACGLLASLAALTAGAQDKRGEQLYRNCVICHGDKAEGMKLLNAPALAPLSEKYIVEQLKKFKAGHRGAHVKDTTGLQMAPMTQTLTSEEDIVAVSSYIASLPSKSQKPTVASGDSERGKALYATCQACHGADGAGNDLLNAPSLLHQHDWYLVSQLQKFKEGVRGSNPNDITGSQMRPMAMMLADEQAMNDVVAYLQSLTK